MPTGVEVWVTELDTKDVTPKRTTRYAVADSTFFTFRCSVLRIPSSFKSMVFSPNLVEARSFLALDCVLLSGLLYLDQKDVLVNHEISCPV